MRNQEHPVVLVTGGASGIGAGIGAYLAERGTRVVLSDSNVRGGARLAEDIDAMFIELDVRSPDSWHKVVDTCVERWGRVDGLVNVAGVKHEQTALSEPEPALYEQVWAVNQLGVLLGIQVVGARMCEQRSGSIVNIASAAGEPPSRSPDVTYASTKWAVRGTSRNAARVFGPFGVRVNCIMPGMVRTPMVEELIAAAPERFSRIASEIPLGRIAEPVDIARATHFFLSELGEYCTGAELVVDGGMNA